MTDMEVDDDLFEDFELGQDELAYIQQEEKQYFSSQKPRLDTKSSKASFNNGDNVAESSVHLEESTSTTVPTVAHGLHTTQSFARTYEDEQVVEGLRFELERASLVKKSHEETEKQQAREIRLLQEMLESKDRDIVNLRKNVAQLKQEDHSAIVVKKQFPGVSRTSKVKGRKMPSSMFDFVGTSMPLQIGLQSTDPMSQMADSTQVGESIEDIPQSQHFSLTKGEEKELGPENTISALHKKAKKDTILRMSSSTAPLSPMQTDMFYDVQKVKTEPMEISLSSASTPPPPSPLSSRVTKKTSTNQLTETVTTKPKPRIRFKQKQPVCNQKLLKILFCEVFKKWNRETQSNSKSLDMALTPILVKKFSHQFAQQFVPEATTCSPETYHKLDLLASDISEYLVKSESVPATIQLLLNTFNICLPICIREKLYQIIENITSTIYQLTIYIKPETANFLYKDMRLNYSASVIQKLTECLALFPFTTMSKRDQRVMKDFDNLNDTNSFTKIDMIAKRYGILPSILKEIIQKTKTPPQAHRTVKTILRLFYCIGKSCAEPAFAYLLKNESFIDLLRPDTTPLDIISCALEVIETSFQQSDWSLIVKPDDSFRYFCDRLTALLRMQQLSLEVHNWYRLRIQTIQVLFRFCNTQIPAHTKNELLLTAYPAVTDLLISESSSVDNSRSVQLNGYRQELINLAFFTIHSVIKKNGETILQAVGQKYSADAVQKIINYVKSVASDEHSVPYVLDDLEKLLKAYVDTQAVSSSIDGSSLRMH